MVSTPVQAQVSSDSVSTAGIAPCYRRFFQSVEWMTGSFMKLSVLLLFDCCSRSSSFICASGKNSQYNGWGLRHRAWNKQYVYETLKVQYVRIYAIKKSTKLFSECEEFWCLALNVLCFKISTVQLAPGPSQSKAPVLATLTGTVRRCHRRPVRTASCTSIWAN